MERYMIKCEKCSLLVLLLVAGLVAGEQCEFKPSDCLDNTCIQRWDCGRGACVVWGGCTCPPCYQGADCSEYVDLYPPVFHEQEASVTIQPHHTGPVYTALVTDRDQDTTCNDDSSAPCPCGNTKVLILSLTSDAENMFSVVPDTGEVTLLDAVLLEPGVVYKMLLAAGSNEEDEFYDDSLVSMTTINFTVTVGDERLPNNDTELQVFNGDEPYSYKPLPPAAALQQLALQSPSSVRIKRGSSGTLPSETLMELTELGTVPAILMPAQTVDYTLAIILPTLDSAMDLLVEVFVMDPLQGRTAFTLCALTLDSFGSALTDASDNPLVKENFPPVFKKNTFLTTIVDRAILNFGDVKNTAASDGSNTTESTISISFSATLISNTDFTPDTAIITAGAEYDAQNFVWVSQASYTYDMKAGYTYPSDVQLTVTSDPVSAYSGVTFSVVAAVTDPKGPLIFEVFTPIASKHNQFTVTGITVTSVGANAHCNGVNPPISYMKHLTVDQRTYHRRTATFDFTRSGLAYPDLIGEVQKEGNKIYIDFTVSLVDAKEDDIVPVGVGIAIGTTTLWTAMANITVAAAAGDPVDAGTATFAVVDIGTNRNVAQHGALTWGVVITVSDGANDLITCTAAAPADHKVCGVVWGDGGPNVAVRPDLSAAVVYVDGAAESWLFNINSTGSSTAAGANEVTLEVSVLFSGTSVADVIITCNGNALTLTGAVSAAAGTLEVFGTVEAINTADSNWYLGSIQAMIVTLTFPGGGVSYSNVSIETAGDLDITNFGTRACHLDIVRVGPAVPCIAGPRAAINNAVTKQKSSVDSVYDDVAVMPLGPGCGVLRGSEPSGPDNQVVIRVIYDLPKSQTITAVAYNLSIGIQFADQLIWTGWVGFNTNTGTPTYSITNSAIVTVVPPDNTTSELGKPMVVLVKLKTRAGTVDSYNIVASLTSVATLSICRIVIIEIGTSFPCVEKEPYGKAAADKDVTTTIVHDASTWGLKATLDFGILRNVGWQEFYADEVADADTLIVGVVLRGMAAGMDTLRVTVNSGAAPAVYDVVLDITEPLTLIGSVTTEWVPADGNNEVFAGVMKVIDFVLTLPEEYSQSLVVTVENAGPADMKTCFVALAKAGKNIPCVLPHMVETVYSSTDVLETYVVSILETCYYELVTANETERQLTVQIGVQFTPTGSGAGTLTATVTEGTTTLFPTTFALVSASAAYTPPTGVDTSGFSVTLVNNDTVIVPVGNTIYIGINIVIPPYLTDVVEVGVMLPTDGRRAYATVHGIEWGPKPGKNVGCLMDFVHYDVKLMQNSTLDGGMIHASQTDTMVAKLGYMTNTGLSYSQGLPTVPDDDTVPLVIKVQLADHPNATHDAVLEFNIAVKFGGVIHVVTKKIKVLRTLFDAMVLRYDVFFTDGPNLLFDRDNNNQIPMTIQLAHENNETIGISRQECNDAFIRVLLPKHVAFVDTSDTFSSNITTTLVEKHYLDFNITNLFFTDVLELNLTVTVDPLKEIPKGSRNISATNLVRLVCTVYSDQSTPRYVGATKIMNYNISGIECYESLGVETMTSCQFSASSAISAATAPEKASPSSGAGWSPTVRSGRSWDHHITLDFLKKTRVTKIAFNPVAVLKKVQAFKMSYSMNGDLFIDSCSETITVDADDTATLPYECVFVARYGRLTIVDAAPDNTAFGVNFDWLGCPMETAAGECVSRTTMLTDANDWRTMAEDTTNGIFYFCDYNPTKKKSVCYSTADGATWTALPAYIAGLVGEDVGTASFYAFDLAGVTSVASVDGVKWKVVQKVVASGVAVTAKSIPGAAEAALTPVVVGSYTGDFTGIKLAGVYVVKWESCCT